MRKCITARLGTRLSQHIHSFIDEYCIHFPQKGAKFKLFEYEHIIINSMSDSLSWQEGIKTN